MAIIRRKNISNQISRERIKQEMAYGNTERLFLVGYRQNTMKTKHPHQIPVKCEGIPTPSRRNYHYNDCAPIKFKHPTKRIQITSLLT